MRPIHIPLAAVADSNGNATFDARLERTGDWRNVEVTLAASGSPKWLLTKAGVPLKPGRGDRTTVGPVLLEPFDTLFVQCSSALPGAQITGSINGVGGELAELLPGFAPQPNTIALDASLVQNTQKNIACPINTTVGPTTIPMPPNSVAVGFLARQDGSNGAPTLLKIVGTQTRTTYYSQNLTPGNGPGLPNGPQWFPFADDTSVDVTVTCGGAAPASIDILATGGALAVEMVQPSAAVFKSQVTDSTGTGIGVDSKTFVNPILSLEVSNAAANAAPWQAAGSVPLGSAPAVTANTDVTLIGAPGGNLKIWLHGISIDSDAAGAQGINLWRGPSANALRAGVFRQTSADAPPARMDYRGAALESNTALVLTFSATANAQIALATSTQF